MFLGEWTIDDVLTFPANTHDVATGAGTDADSVPSYRVYEDETGTAILNGSMAKLDDSNTVGFYSEAITLSGANGFEVNKCYTIYISATVDGVTGTMSHTFKVVNLATIQDFVDGFADEPNAGHLVAGSIGLNISTGGTASGLITSMQTLMGEMLAVIARKDAAAATDFAAALAIINANGGSGAGDYANTTDSLQSQHDALLANARTEPGQGAPPVNPDAMTKLDYLYKWTRNKRDNNGTETKFYADNGTTVDHKQSTTESGGTITKGEIVTGP